MSQILAVTSVLAALTTAALQAGATPCCLVGMVNCAKRNIQYEPLLDLSDLQKRYKDYPPEAMTEAYRVIDEHLARELDTKSAEANLRELASLLSAEVAATGACGLARAFNAAPNLARQLASKDSELMINSMMRLLDLDSVLEVNKACSIYSTRDLIENNLIAQDAIGRRIRKEPRLFARLDDIIFDVALRRAATCISLYAGELQQVTKDRDYNLNLVRSFWREILGSRLNKKYFAASLDEVFAKNAKGALEAVKNMDWAIEPGEMSLILKFLDSMPESSSSSSRKMEGPVERRVSLFEKYLERPCLMYNSVVHHVIKSLEFDLQFEGVLKTSIIEAVENDPETAKHRAYYAMCKKLTDEKYRFEHLLIPDVK